MVRRCSSCSEPLESSDVCKECPSCSSRKKNLSNSNKTARKNNANQAVFERSCLDNPIAEGTFRWVALGKYTSGERVGQQCVCKWFKSGCVYEKEFDETDIQSSEKAIELISRWNERKVVDKPVKVNLPEVWTLTRGAWEGQKVLQEPFIENYQKFNSNSGWNDSSTPWPRVMQALSHYTYHISGGRYLLCDLQGGVYSNGVVLTDPVVMSHEKEYGPTDLGSVGMASWFAHHTCNEYCSKRWKLPLTRRAYYKANSKTSMEGCTPLAVPTRQSRPAMSILGEEIEVPNAQRKC